MSWAHVRGHERLVGPFQDVVRRNRLAHAYLFVGPEGVGKKRFAVELAKALLCEATPARSAGLEDSPRGLAFSSPLPSGGEGSGVRGRLDACDRCHACLQVDARAHPDFQLVGMPEDRHEFPIELIQELTRNLAMKPARGRHRVAIIDDADKFNDEAANAFLKTLEEPPPASLLILVSNNVERQMPTIVSRCQVIRFGRLPADLVAELLLKEGTVEKPEQAAELAQRSAGSLGEARALADPAIWEFRRSLLDGLSGPKIDSVNLAERLVKFVDEAGKESAAKRQRAGFVVRSLIELLQTAVRLQHGGAADGDAQDLAAAKKLAERLDAEQLLTTIERCLLADYQVDRRLQLTLVLEALLDALGERLQTN